MSTHPIDIQARKNQLASNIFHFFSPTHLKQMGIEMMLPMVAIAIFLGFWSATAENINTSLGTFPGPTQVWEQSVVLYQEHTAARTKEAAFYQRMEKRIDKAIAAGKPEEKIEKMRNRQYTGKETFFDQILTSLITVVKFPKNSGLV